MFRPGRVFILIMMLSGLAFSAEADGVISPTDTIPVSDTVCYEASADGSWELVSGKPDELKRKKFISALFAFPFPFGFMGAHRVMLGTKPWVPVVYVATFGGCFGLLPLIDFFVITFSKDISKLENNPHIFMWVTPNESAPTDNSNSE